MVSRQLADNERICLRIRCAAMARRSSSTAANPAEGVEQPPAIRASHRQHPPTGSSSACVPARSSWYGARKARRFPELLLQHLKLKPEQIRDHITIFENEDAIRFVANDRNAITVAALGVAERSVKSGIAIKLLAYGSIPASTRAVRDRTYLLSPPLILVTRSTPTGLQKQLIDYAASGAVTDLHEKHGFVAYEAP